MTGGGHRFQAEVLTGVKDKVGLTVGCPGGSQQLCCQRVCRVRLCFSERPPRQLCVK